MWPGFHFNDAFLPLINLSTAQKCTVLAVRPSAPPHTKSIRSGHLFNNGRARGCKMNECFRYNRVIKNRDGTGLSLMAYLTALSLTRFYCQFRIWCYTHIHGALSDNWVMLVGPRDSTGGRIRRWHWPQQASPLWGTLFQAIPRTWRPPFLSYLGWFIAHLSHTERKFFDHTARVWRGVMCARVSCSFFSSFFLL